MRQMRGDIVLRMDHIVPLRMVLMTYVSLFMTSENCS